MTRKRFTVCRDRSHRGSCIEGFRENHVPQAAPAICFIRYCCDSSGAAVARLCAAARSFAEAASAVAVLMVRPPTLIETLAEVDRQSADGPALASDEQRAAAAAAAKTRKKELVRAAGRAAVEDSLQNGQEGARRSGPCLTTECLAAQWHAYAEVYGTNGLATGSAAALGTRQPEARPAPPPEAPPSAPPSDAPPPRERPLAIWDF